jgi:hypothetical protein
VHFWTAEQTLGDFFGIDSFHGYLASLTSNVAFNFFEDDTWRRYGVRYILSPEPRGDWNQLVGQTDQWKIWRSQKVRNPAWAERDGKCSGADAVHLLRRESDRVVIWADLACPARVILADTYYPGWKGWLDGRQTKIEQVHTSLRSVQAPAGKHRIEMRYRPTSFLLGAGMTLLGLTLAMALQGFDRQNKL